MRCENDFKEVTTTKITKSLIGIKQRILEELFLHANTNERNKHIAENSMDALAYSGGTIKINILLCWDNIHIELTDSGKGFEELSTTQAVQPFMTTKPGKMGLGLSLCRQVLLDHGGDMEIVSDKEKGATVLIKLPTKLTQSSWFADKKQESNKSGI